MFLAYKFRVSIRREVFVRVKVVRELSTRVAALPPDLAKVFLDDLASTAEERLRLFERLAKKQS